jgi:hypothetical protein
MVEEARRAESTIVCHATLYGGADHHAACRGFFDRYPTRPLQLAERLGLIELDPPPGGDGCGWTSSGSPSRVR